jgi:hypothetical protein
MSRQQRRPRRELATLAPRILNQTTAAFEKETQAGCPLAARGRTMIRFLLFCILFVLCWPLALLALIAYPIVWLLLIPFRVVGIAVGGALDLVKAILFLPARVIRAI